MSNDYLRFQGAHDFEGGIEPLRKFVPTLFIGLGGTGKDVLMRFRKNLYDEYGMPSENFAKFLVIDTDDQSDIPRGANEQAYRPVVFRRDLSEFITATINQNEFKDIFEAIRNERDRRYIQWVHPDLENISSDAIVHGAGTYRQVGRLAFFLRYSIIRRTIISHIRDMLEVAADGPQTVFGGRPGEVDPTRIEVVIVTSLAGGTGSGMFIDMAYLVRDILSQESDFSFVTSHTSLIAVLPTVYTRIDTNLAGRFRQNAYAALLEMEKYSTPRPDEDPFKTEQERAVTGDEEGVEFWVNWSDPRRSEQPIRDQAWGSCYLIDDVNNRQPGKLQKPADIYQMIADYLFLDFGTSQFAMAKRSVRANHAQLRNRTVSAEVYDLRVAHENERDPRGAPERRDPDILFENRYGSTFSSLGLAAIYIDKDRIERSAAFRLASALISRRWIGDAAMYAENTYKTWCKEDLQGSKMPGEETESISFHPDDMWRELLKGQEHNWLDNVKKQFQQLEEQNPLEGFHVLQDALEKNRQALASRTTADGLPGAARRTLDSRLLELRGSPADMGKMRRRLSALARQRFMKIGVLPTLELLKVYQEAFVHAAKRANKQQRMTNLSDRHILARLRDAQEVPWLCRRIATRIEYDRAFRLARDEVQKRYAIAAGEHLETLANTLRVHIGAEQSGATHGIEKTLYEEYSSIRDFLQELQKRFGKRFDELQRVSRSDRKRSLVPEWSEEQYDVEIKKALLLHPEIGQTKVPHEVDWERAELLLLREISAESMSTFVDQSIDTYQRRGDALYEIADRISSACKKILEGRINLDDFGRGNVVDYMMALRSATQRQEFLTKMVEASATYFPLIGSYRLVVPPAHRNILGRPGGSGHDGIKNAETVTEEIQNISQQQGADPGGHHEIDAVEDGLPTSIALVRETGGLPLHYYSRLGELEAGYYDHANADFQKTCHIRCNETFRDLPDIKLIEPVDIGYIREHIPYVLWAFTLAEIKLDTQDRVFVIEVPDPDFGKDLIHLGTRMSRIIKQACERPEVRGYLRMFWKRWRNKANATSLAVLYCAIRENLKLFPRSQEARDRKPKPPLFNCYKMMLTETAKELLCEANQGEKWHRILRWDDDDDDDGTDKLRETRKARYDKICQEIRDKCLRPASDELPLYQVNLKAISEIQLPDIEADEQEAQTDDDSEAS